MTVFNWLALFSIPTLIASLWAHLIRRRKHSDEQTKALQRGVQALKRAFITFLQKVFQTWLR